jgi:hypothetical protein
VVSLLLKFSAKILHDFFICIYNRVVPLASLSLMYSHTHTHVHFKNICEGIYKVEIMVLWDVVPCSCYESTWSHIPQYWYFSIYRWELHISYIHYIIFSIPILLPLFQVQILFFTTLFTDTLICVCVSRISNSEWTIMCRYFLQVIWNEEIAHVMFGHM